MPKITDPTDRGIPVADLYALFDYDPDEGVLYWRTVGRGRASKGDEAGTINKTSGNIAVRVRGLSIPAARIVMAMNDPMARWPMEPVKFRDGNPLNLRLGNLTIPSKARSEPHRNLVARELRRVNRAAVAYLESDRTLSGDWFYNQKEKAEALLVLSNSESTDDAKAVAQRRYDTADMQLGRMMYAARNYLRGEYPFKFSEKHLRPRGRPQKSWR